MKNVLVTLKIYLKEYFNHSLRHPGFLYIPELLRFWVTELPSVVMILETSWLSNCLEVLYKIHQPSKSVQRRTPGHLTLVSLGWYLGYEF